MSNLSPVLDRTDTNNPDDVRHIVDQHLPGNCIADASIFGTEVIALCGFVLIPTRDHQNLPTCEACKLVLSAIA